LIKVQHRLFGGLLLNEAQNINVVALYPRLVLPVVPFSPHAFWRR